MGIFGTSLLGQWTELIHANEHPELYGYTLTAVILAAQCGCTPFYYFAGRAYTKYMTEQDEASQAFLLENSQDGGSDNEEEDIGVEKPKAPGNGQEGETKS